MEDNSEGYCKEWVCCGKAENRLYTSCYCQSVIMGRDRGTRWKVPMTGQCLHHRGAISQWRLESEFELSWCARVAQRAKGSKKGGGQGQVFEGWSVGLVGCVSKDQAAAKNDRERQMTGFIVDNQAALNGTKKRRKGGQLRQSTAQQDLYQASSISYARSPRPSVLTNWQWPGRRWKASERLPDGGRVGGHWANGAAMGEFQAARHTRETKAGSLFLANEAAVREEW